jgi:glucose/arabinose dehydrogenase
MINFDPLGNDVDADNDLDVTTLLIESPPETGIAMVDAENGRITYTSNRSSVSTDTLTYTIKDSRGEKSNPATITINVDTSTRLPNNTFNLPESIPAGAFKLENAVPDIGFSQPVNMAFPPGETDRLFVVEKTGRIQVINDFSSEAPTSSVFLDIRSRLSFTAERGLLGLAFHPEFESNGTFFVVYTDNVTPSPNPFPGYETRHTILSRFKVSDTNRNQADLNSETILIRQVDRDPGHQAGDLEFGPDGYLYYSTGDEGSQTDSYKNTQTITKNFFSGILRLDVDKRPGNPEPSPHPSVKLDGNGKAYYSIPQDNPWVNATSFEGRPFGENDAIRTEFYAVGLRNPWQMSFDPLNGDLYVGDVGSGGREEINKIVKAGNYQWAYMEGSINGPKLDRMPDGFVGNPPLYDYPRKGTAASVIGGIVYRGNKIPDLYGKYIFADHHISKIWALTEASGGQVTVDILTYEGGITSFIADPNNGDILMSDFQGTIWRLVEDKGAVPDIPATLTETGTYAELTNLVPNPGIYPYDVNLRFWSDHASKQRLFSIPNPEDQMIWDADNPWEFPVGMFWVKHFELEMERGNPETKNGWKPGFSSKPRTEFVALVIAGMKPRMKPSSSMRMELRSIISSTIKASKSSRPGRFPAGQIACNAIRISLEAL